MKKSNILNYPNYHITVDGQVYNIKTGRCLKPGKHEFGYPQVSLSKNGRTTKVSVHRLVAAAYIPNPNQLPCVMHLDDYFFNLPDGADTVTVSFLPNEYRVFALNIDQYQTANITPYISNWDIVSSTLSRKDFTGVTVEVANPFEITGLARDLFIKIVEEKGIYARIGLNIYRRRARSNDYDILREMEADMLSYEESDDYVSIGIIRNDLQEIVKTGKSTKYDIPVSSIADAKKWNYRDRMTLLNNVTYNIAETTEPIPNIYPQATEMYLPISYFKGELMPNKVNSNLELRDQAFTPPTSDYDEQYFFKTKYELTVDIRLKFKIRFGVENTRSTPMDFEFYITSQRSPEIRLWDATSITVQPGFHDIEFDIDELLQDQVIGEDTKLTFICGLGGLIRINWIQCISFEDFNMIWKSSASEVTNISLIRPEVLLQTYLNRISRVDGKYTAIIEWDETFTPMICAAETLRDFPNAVLHGSIKDFMAWMTVLGYEYSYEGRTMRYKKRDLFYKKDVVALELSNREISKLRKISNEEVAYTSVQIGYKKEDYNESINGKLEINAQFDYSTGYFNQKETVLSLISPYRSDSIGVEILLNKRGEKITDNSSDNDIFALQMQEDSTEFVYSEENRMAADEILLYNGSLCPHFLVERNKTIMGIITNKVSFTGTDGYRQGTIGGQDIIYSDIEITDRLFQPFNYKFNVGSHLDMPDVNARDGVIKFTYKGVERTGFIYEIDKFFTEQEGEWLLFMLT